MTQRVLLVEHDDETIAQLAAELRRAGLWVRLARTGVEAASACAAADVPDLFVLDDEVPGGEARRLLDELRSHHGCADLPALLLVTRVLDGDVRWGWSHGTDYLLKPFEAPAFLARVEQRLRPARTVPAPSDPPRSSPLPPRPRQHGESLDPGSGPAGLDRAARAGRTVAPWEAASSR